MGDIGTYASNLMLNTKSLKEFDEAIRAIKREMAIKKKEKTAIINKLLEIINPILEVIKGDLSASISVSEFKIVDILKTRHEYEWQIYKNRIIKLSERLNSEEEIQLSNSDFQLLDDIADALDAECANLFRRMGERI